MTMAEWLHLGIEFFFNKKGLSCLLQLRDELQLQLYKEDDQKKVVDSSSSPPSMMNLH